MSETNGSDSASYWGDDWIECYDAKARRTKPGICFLADGIQLPLDALGLQSSADVPETFPKNRIEAWRIAGNAIVPQLAAAFIRSVLNCEAPSILQNVDYSSQSTKQVTGIQLPTARKAAPRRCKKIDESRISHGFTKRDDYGKCPMLYYAKHIAKELTFVETEHTRLGNVAHKILEEAVLTGLDTIDRSAAHESMSEAMQGYNEALLDGLQRSLDDANRMTGLKLVEQEWALGFDCKPTDWFGRVRPVYDRAKADLVNLNRTMATVRDYKTGSVKGVHQAQLEDMAIHTFMRFPSITRVSAAFDMLRESDRDRLVERVYDRTSEQIINRLKYWSEHHKEILRNNAEGEWAPKPGNNCKWCDYSDCRHHPQQAL